ncbi:MAG: hypothetical protein AAB378_01695 [Patescibacteria group bacterium]
MSIGGFLCSFGLHKFEKEPSVKELIKETGLDFVFWSEGVQKGVKNCRRDGCEVTKKVWRKGMVGSGGQAGRWKKLDERQELYIDSLPVM